MGVKNRRTKSQQRLFQKRSDSRRRFDDSEFKTDKSSGSSFLEVSWASGKNGANTGQRSLKRRPSIDA